MKVKPKLKGCPCGGHKAYSDCCGSYLDNAKVPATAEILMRSRYAAYTLKREDYLLATWHCSTRPVSLELADQSHDQWLGLAVKRHEQLTPKDAIVEFVARYKVGGRAYRLHEISRFVCDNGRWFYVDGDII
ncbi:YchJ family protein [Nitrosomonas aestuarii]|uniref:YchJ family protein n=1 Tax=Nitrosomonas aestuarii TaxID=52441 RepID=UPI000D31AF4B|nr:SEC-C motif-containing protein [Nitrosomonas aestuarii]